jgi:hypothetical protein
MRPPPRCFCWPPRLLTVGAHGNAPAVEVFLLTSAPPDGRGAWQCARRRGVLADSPHLPPEEASHPNRESHRGDERLMGRARGQQLSTHLGCHASRDPLQIARAGHPASRDRNPGRWTRASHPARSLQTLQGPLTRRVIVSQFDSEAITRLDDADRIVFASRIAARDRARNDLQTDHASRCRLFRSFPPNHASGRRPSRATAEAFVFGSGLGKWAPVGLGRRRAPRRGGAPAFVLALRAVGLGSDVVRRRERSASLRAGAPGVGLRRFTSSD